MPSRRHWRQTAPLSLATTRASSCSDPPALRWPATVVRNRGSVLDRQDLEPGGLERADRRLAPRPRPLDADVDRAHAVLLGCVGRLLRRGLGRERRALARALEALAPGRGP